VTTPAVKSFSAGKSRAAAGVIPRAGRRSFDDGVGVNECLLNLQERPYSGHGVRSEKCHERTCGFLLDHSRLAGVTAYTKKKGRLRCHKRPKAREETPKEGCDSAGGDYRIPRAKTIRDQRSIERKDHGPIRTFMALVLKADHFRKGSFAIESDRPRNVRCSPDSDPCVRRKATSSGIGHSRPYFEAFAILCSK
jgi:hypothetical protein